VWGDTLELLQIQMVFNAARHRRWDRFGYSAVVVSLEETYEVSTASIIRVMNDEDTLKRRSTTRLHGAIFVLAAKRIWNVTGTDRLVRDNCFCVNEAWSAQHDRRAVWLRMRRSLDNGCGSYIFWTECTVYCYMLSSTCVVPGCTTLIVIFCEVFLSTSIIKLTNYLFTQYLLTN
jgi:hypothetical protein